MTLTEALYALHKAGKVHRPWLSGMRCATANYDTVRVVEVDADGAIVWARPGAKSWRPADLGEPDLTDPATVGCLLALLREASWDSSLCAIRNRSREFGAAGASSWGVASCDAPDHPTPERMGYCTEGEAIAAALVQFAGGA